MSPPRDALMSLPSCRSEKRKVLRCVCVCVGKARAATSTAADAARPVNRGDDDVDDDENRVAEKSTKRRLTKRAHDRVRHQQHRVLSHLGGGSAPTFLAAAAVAAAATQPFTLLLPPARVIERRMGQSLLSSPLSKCFPFLLCVYPDIENTQTERPVSV